MTMANATMTSPPTNGVSSRKTNKPLMEKRRRARINDSLSQLKSLVIQSSKKDSSQFNKLEKADILELTVKYLRNLQNQQHMQQQQSATSSDATLAGKYQAGFMECANEVIRYLGQSQGFTDDIKSRVVGHLASCVQLASKSSFSKPQTNAAPTTAVAAQQHTTTTAAQLPNGQIIQIVNGPYHQMKQYVPQAASARITSSPANLSTSTTNCQAPVSAASSPVSVSSPSSSPYSRYTQPLHIQIPPAISPVLIQPKVPQQQKISQPQQHQQLPRLQEPVPHSHLPAPPQEKVISSSSSPSPRPRDRSLSPVPMRGAPKHVSYYLEDDYLPRPRTYSMTSSSSDSELISPLNLSQSPQYYKDSAYTYTASHQDCHQQVPLSASDRISPGHYVLSDQSVFSSRHHHHHPHPTHFASVIVDGRKSMDVGTLKYMSMVMEDERHCIRHEESTSPASSVGEERLWRPW